MNPIPLIVWLVLLVIALGLGAAGGYFFHRYQTEKANRDRQEKAVP